MTSYILDVISVLPLLKNKPRQAIILCHGYGGSGKDISTLAINWQRFLPDAIFLCPNAPEVCSVNPQGYQWFDLTIEKEEVILEKSLIAEEKLNTFLDQVFDNLQLEPNNLALVGFSQGCMMSIQVGLKRKKKINCLIGILCSQFLNILVLALMPHFFKYSFASNKCVGETIVSFSPCIKNIFGLELTLFERCF